MMLSSRRPRRSLLVYHVKASLTIYDSGKDFMLDAIDVLKGVSI